MTTVVRETLDDGTTLEELCAQLNIARSQAIAAQKRVGQAKRLIIELTGFAHKQEDIESFADLDERCQVTLSRSITDSIVVNLDTLVVGGV